MGDSTPICRCRVLYLGSVVPRQSKDGLQGIQEPLRSLYPSDGAVGVKGIDSWLSVWSNGILMENVDEHLKHITRFFPIESLHYCAAVRHVLIPDRDSSNPEPKFLPLDSPFARMPRAQHPPIFAAILRRTTGIKVLECHVFICKREAAANALVRCCFHAYADNSYARQLDTGGSKGTVSSVCGSLTSTNINKSLPLTGIPARKHHHLNPTTYNEEWRSRAGSSTTLNSVESRLSLNGGFSNNSTVEGYTSVKNFYGSNGDLGAMVNDGEISFCNSDRNHKVWNGSQDHVDSAESPCELFSDNSLSLGRSVRSRQISTPIDIQPPPLREENTKMKKEKKKLKSCRSQSLSGTLIRPKAIHVNSLLQRPKIHYSLTAGKMNGQSMGQHQNQKPSHPFNARHFHTIGHRSFLMTGGFGQDSGSYSAHQPGMSPFHLTTPHASSNHLNIPLQMPILVPQQYATVQHSSSTKKKKDKRNGIPVQMPIVPSFNAYQHLHYPQAKLNQSHQAHLDVQSIIDDSRPLVVSRKFATSMGNVLDDSGNSGAESAVGTGIYRHKGHLNERAFSYSIRQEHRSRSHGSLASLKFNPPDMKKEREIAQMVAGLNLSDDCQSMVPAITTRKQSVSNGLGGESQIICSNGNGVDIYRNQSELPSSFSKREYNAVNSNTVQRVKNV